jgi:YihY family inner membrane protein
MPREGVRAALLAVDDAHRGRAFQPRVAQRLHRRQGRSAGRDDVLDEAYALPGLEHALEPFVRPVALRLLADDEKRQAGGERGRGRERHGAELGSGDPRCVRLVLSHLCRQAFAEGAQQLGLRLEAVLVEVVARAAAAPQDEVAFEIRVFPQRVAELGVSHPRSLRGVHRAEDTPYVKRRKRALFAKFFADRGTHLAAMIAYFALLSFVPLTFLALALLGFSGRADESSFLVTELKHAFPEAPVGDIVSLVRQVQDNARTLGIVGGAFLVWTALSLFSVLESAFNIVYGKPNRSFLRGKTIASVLMLGSLVTLFVALLVGSLGVAFLRRYTPNAVDNEVSAYVLTVLVSSLGVFVFVASVYYLLTNAPLTIRAVLPGAVLATVVLEAGFQVLPVYVRYTDLNPVLKTFGPPAILLVWNYVMANVLVFGAELNWWVGMRREPSEEGAGLG